MDNLEAVKALIVKQDLMNQNVELAVAKLERMVSVDFHQNSVEWKDKLNKLKSCQVEANADIEAKISKLVDNYASDEVAWHVDPPPPALGRGEALPIPPTPPTQPTPPALGRGAAPPPPLSFASTIGVHSNAAGFLKPPGEGHTSPLHHADATWRTISAFDADNTRVGAVTGKLFSRRDSVSFEIFALRVAEEFRGRGVGSRLLCELDATVASYTSKANAKNYIMRIPECGDCHCSIECALLYLKHGWLVTLGEKTLDKAALVGALNDGVVTINGMRAEMAKKHLPGAADDATDATDSDSEWAGRGCAPPKGDLADGQVPPAVLEQVFVAAREGRRTPEEQVRSDFNKALFVPRHQSLLNKANEAVRARRKRERDCVDHREENNALKQRNSQLTAFIEKHNLRLALGNYLATGGAAGATPQPK